MAGETILQHFILQDFILPFVLVFVILFAILQKTQILGDGKKQIDAITSMVVALIFVSFANPKLIVANLVLVLTVAIVVVFVAMLLWGFVVGGEAKFTFSDDAKWMKWVIGIGVSLVALVGLFWASGFEPKILEMLFYQSWSATFWTNTAFIVAIGIALAVILKTPVVSGGSS